MATILLAGATGTVGSALLPLLVGEGHEVVSLVRPKGDQNPCGRVRGKVLAGDITLPNCGLGEQDIKAWRGKIVKIVNSAACLKFQEANAEEASKVNVHGLRNLLALAEKLGVPEFHQVSTAYVSGNADCFSEDDSAIESAGRNVYERTKAAAENAVTEWKQGRHSIYRLGIVVGDSRTGATCAFNGYYVFMKAFWELKKILFSRGSEDLRGLREEGIYFDVDGSLNFPVCIGFSTSSTLNLVPQDWTCKTLAKLVNLPAEGKKFHLVHPEPKKICWINDISLQKCLGIKGYSYGVPGEQGKELSRLQRAFDRMTGQYKPYVTHEAKFEVSNAQRILGKAYTRPPEVTQELIGKLLDYAKRVNFGREE